MEYYIIERGYGREWVMGGGGGVREVRDSKAVGSISCVISSYLQEFLPGWVPGVVSSLPPSLHAKIKIFMRHKNPSATARQGIEIAGTFMHS